MISSMRQEECFLPAFLTDTVGYSTHADNCYHEIY